MAINKETQVSASVVLEKEVYEKLKDISKGNKRSVSSQIAFIIENFIAEHESSEK
jgi:predicted DNA-binding protein